MNNYTLYARLKKLTPDKFLSMVEKRQVKLKQPNPAIVAKVMRRISKLDAMQNVIPDN